MPIPVRSWQWQPPRAALAHKGFVVNIPCHLPLRQHTVQNEACAPAHEGLDAEIWTEPARVFFTSAKYNALRRCTSSSSKACPVSVRLMGPKMLQWDSSSDSILNQPINKNSILSKYNEDCHKLGYSGQLTSTKKLSQHIYLHIYQPLDLLQINLYTHKNGCCRDSKCVGRYKKNKDLVLARDDYQ